MDGVVQIVFKSVDQGKNCKVFKKENFLFSLQILNVKNLVRNSGPTVFHS